MTLHSKTKKLRKSILGQYPGLLEDPAGLAVLDSGLAAHSRMLLAQEEIDRRGIVQEDRFGMPKTNPACIIARDGQAAWLAAVRLLGLHLEPAPSAKPGRPYGS